MLKERTLKILSSEYESKILVFDMEGIFNRIDYTAWMSKEGFNIVDYNDVEQFRFIYETKIKASTDRVLVCVSSDIYVPYDIRQHFYCVTLSVQIIFPRLNGDYLNENKSINLSLVAMAYENLFSDITVYEKTVEFIEREAYRKENVDNYIQVQIEEMKNIVCNTQLNFNEWLEIAEQKAHIGYLAARCDIGVDMVFLDDAFKQFVQDGYKNISTAYIDGAPSIITKALDYITARSPKAALIVMDGMSAVDFEIIATELGQIQYTKKFSCAIVPTTTAISRQSLLSGKYPVELERPFNLSMEEKGFTEKAQSLGYTENQVCYCRGFNIDLRPTIKLLAIIINDIDDLVHGQTQGIKGMYNDVLLFAQNGKLKQIISRLVAQGFSVYLTADHGNTLCVGIGKVYGQGIEVETKAKRMMILKNFADYDKVLYDKQLIEYPGYYMDKNYKYLICDTGLSFDNVGEVVITHGGMSIDEVIVPFITIKEA